MTIGRTQHISFAAITPLGIYPLVLCERMLEERLRKLFTVIKDLRWFKTVKKGEKVCLLTSLNF